MNCGIFGIPRWVYCHPTNSVLECLYITYGRVLYGAGILPELSDVCQVNKSCVSIFDEVSIKVRKIVAEP